MKQVITFSGCPGGDPKATQPNWITSSWPPEFPQMLEWQWKERVVPYWKETAKLLKQSGVRVAIEMHPNFVAYNPETMLRLSDVAPGTIGCNFDPSHMFWQQVDVPTAIRALGDRIYHVHAKDCKIDPGNTALNGVLDVKKYTDEIHRSWVFRTVGYGNGQSVWRDIVSNLRMVGYDHVISIEHEDCLMSGDEGLKKAIETLRERRHQRAGRKGVLGVSCRSRIADRGGRWRLYLVATRCGSWRSAARRQRRRRSGSRRWSTAAEQHAAHYHQAAAAATVFKPKVFNAAQNKTVTTLAEIIIPQTDTAGATKAKVNEFIDAVLADAKPDDRQKFLDGLAWIDTRSQADNGAPFAEAPRQRSRSRC